jgi:hypothetical protein
MIEDDDRVYVIYDVQDHTFWCDVDEEEGWLKDPARAKRLYGFVEAAKEMHEVDCEVWLRDRLKLFIDGPHLVENCRDWQAKDMLAAVGLGEAVFRDFEDDEELEELIEDDEEPPPWPPCIRTGS